MIDDFVASLRQPWMVGVYLGVNAFPDVYAVVDGPDCLFFKAEYVQGSQDLGSTLLDPSGRHRVAHTLADTVNVVLDREREIAELIRRVAEPPAAAMVLVTAMPMTAITGSQYDRIAREVAERVGKVVAEVPARSLQGDWLDGYESVVNTIAGAIPLPAGVTPDPADVAIVGLLLDRTEADRRADVLELRRLVTDGTGARVRSVWPSNQPIERLADVAHAGTLISLPYGRKAARILAKRTGARVVEVDLPFGSAATARFVRAVAEAVGASDRAERFLAAEDRALRPMLDAARAHALDGKRLVFLGEPGLGERVIELAAEVGARVVAAASTRHPPRPLGDLPSPSAAQKAGADLVLTTTRGLEIVSALSLPWMEIGFPSYGTHALATVPMLGFRGAIAVVEAMARALEFGRRAMATLPVSFRDELRPS